MVGTQANMEGTWGKCTSRLKSVQLQTISTDLPESTQINDTSACGQQAAHLLDTYSC